MSRGVSGQISPAGEIIHELPCMTEGNALIRVTPQGFKETIFTRFGQWIEEIALAILILQLAWLARVK